MRPSLFSLFLLATSALASAQSLPSAPHLDLLHRGAFLLNDPKVQASLKISAAQQSSLSGVFRTLSDRQSKLLQAARPDDKALAQADRVASEAALQVLSADQRAKLLTLAVKDAGYSALVAPDIAARLSLKPAQVNRIRAILNKAEEPIVELEGIIAEQVGKDPKSANEVERAYRAERIRRNKNRLNEEKNTLSVLTPAQLKIWASLNG